MDIRLTALVVDDSRVMRSMVMESLKKAQLADFTFEEAEDGAVALEKVKAGDFHIGFVDWNMPNMSGIDFVKHVRVWEKQKGETPIPFVMVTSEKTMGKIQEALDQAGANAYICKPFTVEEMQFKLKKVVDGAHIALVRRMRQRGVAVPAK